MDWPKTTNWWWNSASSRINIFQTDASVLFYIPTVPQTTRYLFYKFTLIRRALAPLHSVATPRSGQGVPRNTLTWKKKFIYNNWKFFFCLSLKKKKLGTPSIKIKNTLNKKKFLTVPHTEIFTKNGRWLGSFIFTKSSNLR